MPAERVSAGTFVIMLSAIAVELPSPRYEMPGAVINTWRPMENVSEGILNRIGRGDKAAVDECIERYGDLIWSIARRFCANPADAEDAVQDIFIDVWTNARRYRDDIAAESTFIAMIARRRMIDRIRRSGRRPQTDSIDETFELPDTAAEAQIERHAEFEQVRIALAGLSSDQQRVLHLSVFKGLSHGDIAKQTGMPLGTVKTHIRRGLNAVREQLVPAKRTADLA